MQLVDAGADLRPRDKDNWPTLYGALMLAGDEEDVDAEPAAAVLEADSPEQPLSAPEGGAQLQCTDTEATSAAGLQHASRAAASSGSSAEAAVRTSRRVARDIVDRIADFSDGDVMKRIPALHAALSRLPDFELTLKFTFQTWVPLLGRLLPSDTCIVTKVGSGLRLDCTLAGMALSGMAWKRGVLSYMFMGAQAGTRSGKWFVVDHIGKRFADMMPEQGEMTAADRAYSIDSMLCSSWPSMDWWSREVAFTRATTGWISQRPLSERIAGFDADVYEMNGLQLRVDIRDPLAPGLERDIHQRFKRRKAKAQGAGRGRATGNKTQHAGAAAESSDDTDTGTSRGSSDSAFLPGSQQGEVAGRGAGTASPHAEALAALASAINLDPATINGQDLRATAAALAAAVAEAHHEPEHGDTAPAARESKGDDDHDADDADDADDENEDDDDGDDDGCAGDARQRGEQGGAAAGESTDGKDEAEHDEGAECRPGGAEQRSTLTHRMRVARGGSERLQLDVPAGTTLHWHLLCDRHDVGVRVVVWVPTSAAGAPAFTARSTAEAKDDANAAEHARILRDVGRTSADVGSFTADGSAHVWELTLDNSYAFWHDKEVSVTCRRETSGSGGVGACSPATSDQSPSGATNTPSSTSSSAAAAAAASRTRLQRQLKEFPDHPLSRLIFPTCGLVEVAFEDYFHLPRGVAAAAAGRPGDSLPPTAVFVRPPRSRRFTKSFKAQVAMAPDFPIGIDALLPVAEVLSRTSKHFDNVHRFLQTKVCFS